MASTGMNNAMVRIENRKKLTNLLYKESGITKQDLSHRLHLSAPTINLLVQQMEEDDLVFYQSAEQSSGGRIPNLVCFNYNAYITAGIDIQKKCFRILLLNLKCQILDKITVERKFEAAENYWKDIRVAVDKILEKNQIDSERFRGVGIAVPGPVNQDEKIFSSMLLNISEYSYREAEEIIEYPLVIENDANSAGFAEIWNSDDIDDAAYLSVSKGVGGTIINHREVVRGENGFSGEFGHMTIVPNGELCLCGRRGCLDMYCSTGILSQYTEDSLEKFFEEKKKNDFLKEQWEKYLQYLEIGVSNLAVILDYPVIIGGELATFLQEDFNGFKKQIESLNPFKRKTSICKLSALGADSSAIGAALIIIQNVLDK